jgi:hypothetical protein
MQEFEEEEEEQTLEEQDLFLNRVFKNIEMGFNLICKGLKPLFHYGIIPLILYCAVNSISTYKRPHSYLTAILPMSLIKGKAHTIMSKRAMLRAIKQGFGIFGASYRRRNIGQMRVLRDYHIDHSRMSATRDFHSRELWT